MVNDPIELAALTVDALVELHNELMGELANSGRMSADEIAKWDRALVATLNYRPELAA